MGLAAYTTSVISADRLIAQGATAGEMCLVIEGAILARQRKSGGSVETSRHADANTCNLGRL